MNVWSMKADKTSSGSGVLFRQLTRVKRPAIAALPRGSQADLRGKYRPAFIGLCLFTLMMYLRPQEMIPGLFGSVPLVKIMTICTVLIYLFSKLGARDRVMTWPLEMKMVAAMWLIGFILMPFATSPGDSFGVLFDTFFKTVVVFILLINLVDTRSRLNLLLHLMVFCLPLYAYSAINGYLAGGYGDSFGKRIQGWGTMFSNPNDFASVLTVMIPFAIIFALTRPGFRSLFYLGCAVGASIAVILTFSRSGFLGLVLSCATIAWKLSRGRRLKTILAALVFAVVLLMAMPGKYVGRLSTIFNPETDTTHSAQERQQVAKRAAELAVRRVAVGIGMGNFHTYSIKDMLAHNSYLETAAELGLAGLIAYLIVIFAPLRSLRRIELETREDGARPEWELHVISVCLQASLVAYIIFGLFGSVQYMNFLYFTVGYAVALRRIYSAENAGALPDDQAGKPVLRSRPGLAKGKLWRPHRVRQLWLTDGDR